MKKVSRRTAVKSLIIAGGGLFATFSGIKLYGIYKSPDFTFLENNKLLLNHLCEIIIPETDSPGAGQANVGEMIIKLVRECTEVNSQNNFIEGLKDLADYSEDKYGNSFIQCNNAQKSDIVAHYENKSSQDNGLISKVKNKILGVPFFVLLKKYTVIGYFSSFEGATKALSYDYIPGNYASMPLTPFTKAWATE